MPCQTKREMLSARKLRSWAWTEANNKQKDLRVVLSKRQAAKQQVRETTERNLKNQKVKEVSENFPELPDEKLEGTVDNK